MSDPVTENYKKAVAKAIERYGDRVEKISKQMAPLRAELDKLSENKSPGDDDKKKIADLKKQIEQLQVLLDNSALSLKLDLMLLELPKDADPKEAKKLPDWMEEIIRKKGVPLGKDVTLTPNVGFDFKAGKVKSFGITIKITY